MEREKSARDVNWLQDGPTNIGIAQSNRKMDNQGSSMKRENASGRGKEEEELRTHSAESISSICVLVSASRSVGPLGGRGGNGSM